MFLIYISSTTKIKTLKGHIECCFNNTALIFLDSTWKSFKCTAESELKKLYTSLNLNKLPLNAKKTKFIAFSHSSANQPKNVSIKFHAAECKNKKNCYCQSIENTKTLK